MRIKDVFCDVCCVKTDYNTDWKRPSFIKDSEEPLYKYLSSLKIEDFCSPCFESIKNRFKDVLTFLQNEKQAHID